MELKLELKIKCGEKNQSGRHKTGGISIYLFFFLRKNNGIIFQFS